jgi:hypothetical protein
LMAALTGRGVFLLTGLLLIGTAVLLLIKQGRVSLRTSPSPAMLNSPSQDELARLRKDLESISRQITNFKAG